MKGLKWSVDLDDRVQFFDFYPILSFTANVSLVDSTDCVGVTNPTVVCP